MKPPEIVVTIKNVYDGGNAVNQAEGDLNRLVNKAKVLSEAFRFGGGSTKQLDDHVKAWKEHGRQLEKEVAESNKRVEANHKATSRAISASVKAQTEADVKQAKLSANELIASIDRVKAAGRSLNQGQSGSGLVGSMFSGTLLGSFLGGGAAGAVASGVNLGISSVKSLTSEALDLSRQAVSLAADFQMTNNAVAVFAGSAAGARRELKELDDVALNTPGLRMESAEDGYKRLRALGFGAETARGLIAGLAKERLISGAQEQDVQRVIVNFTQISASTGRLSQDLKEIIHAMPSMRTAMFDAFGTLDTGKLKAIIDKDPEAFFKKLSVAMNAANAPTGGLTNAIEKLDDRFVKAGREFGEPILEPLLKEVDDLTGFLDRNESVWRSWGQAAADALRGAGDSWRGLYAIYKELGLDVPDSEASWPRYLLRKGGSALGKGLLNTATLGVPGLLEFDATTGRIDRENEQAGKDAQLLAEHNANRPGWLKQMGYSADFIGPISGDAVSEKRAADQAAEEKRLQQIEASRKREQELDKQQRDLSISLLKDRFSVEEAARDAHLRFTQAQELSFQKSELTARDRNYRQEIALQADYYAKQIKLAGDDKDKVHDLEVERSKVLSNLNAQREVAEIQSQKRIAEIQKQMADQRRAAAIEANNLDLRESKTSVAAREFDFQRLVEKTGHGYEELRTLSAASWTDTTAEIRKNLALQLQDSTLTAEQRKNLERQANLDIEDATEAHRQRLLAIEDQKNSRRLQQIQDYTSRATAILQQSVSGFQSVMGAMQPSPFFGAALPEVGMSSSVGGISNSFSLTGDLLDVERGKLSIYQAQANMLDRLHDKQRDVADEEIKGARALIAAQQMVGTSDQVNAAKNALRVLLLRREQLGVDQAIEANNLKLSGDLETINEWTEKIGKGERDNVLHSIARVDLAKQYQLAIIESRQQAVLFGDKELVSLTRQTELVKAITAMRNEELKALIRIDRANLEIDHSMEISGNKIKAGVLEHLAQQKTLNASIVDGINGTYDAILKRIDEPLDKLNERSKGMLSFITEPLKAIQHSAVTSVTRSLIDKIIPDGPLKDALNSTGNPVLDESKKQTTLLEQIRDNTGGGHSLIPGLNPTRGAAVGSLGGILQTLVGGGGNGPGGTPYFNPNAAGVGPLGTLGGASSRAEQVLTGAGGGASSTGGGLLGKVFGVAGRVAPLIGLASMGVGLLARLFHHDDAEKKLREAALSEYGVDIRSKSVLVQLVAVGEGSFGKGQVGAHALEIVSSEDGRSIIEAYAQGTGQSTSKLDKLNYSDANWAGNNFSQRFGGFRVSGGGIGSSSSYVVGQSSTDAFTSAINGTLLPSTSQVSTTDASSTKIDRVLLASVAEALHRNADVIGRLNAVPADHVVAMGLGANPNLAAEAYERSLNGNPYTSEALGRARGEFR